MTSSDPGISALRRRMVDDMRMRKFAPRTQSGYLRAVRQFARFLGRSPDTATVEDLRNYQLHLVDHGTSPVSLNAAISGLKFFFDVTLDQPQLMARMQPVRVPRTLPVILSPDEVRRLIAAAGNLKHQTALSVAYGAGLRASEVVALKVGDVDSQRMTLRIEQGKGRRDRYAMLSPVLLERLRVWWRVAHAQGRMLEGGWLFPGLDPVDPLSTRQLNRAIHAAAEEAHLGKRVSMHTLRHYVPFRVMSGDTIEPRRSTEDCGVVKQIAQAITRHNLVRLKTVQEAEEFVCRLEASWRAASRSCFRKGLFLHRKGRFDIDLRGFHRFMPEPQRDDRATNA
ncbi:tyrosine-type recombinase/integrase [Paraburkholderia aromaticivorans]|uniref:tyrosine-type recombinase/integrase n=1 Tax=Paraburkholderia aromaticivorans TaxID=2026199 RepID=UPI001F0FFC6F|nr:site-specific integrase [Paraburkholderia aromaticivorans]